MDAALSGTLATMCPAVPYALAAKRVDAPEQVGPAWDRALAADGPVLIDAVTDPEVPPLPPHIRFEQAKGMTKAILHGDPAAARDIRHSLRGKLAELVTRS